MTDKKKRFYRLLERQINGLRKEAVELIYGKGSRIEVHSWTHNIKGDTFIFELIGVILGPQPLQLHLQVHQSFLVLYQ